MVGIVLKALGGVRYTTISTPGLSGDGMGGGDCSRAGVDADAGQGLFWLVAGGLFYLGAVSSR